MLRVDCSAQGGCGSRSGCSVIVGLVKWQSAFSLVVCGWALEGEVSW